MQDHVTATPRLVAAPPKRFPSVLRPASLRAATRSIMMIGVTTSSTSGIITIGYEGRTAEDLVGDLVTRGVEVLVDVRLTPISRKPGLSKSRLSELLSEVGIAYLHLPALGNPRNNREGFRDGDPGSRTRFANRLRSGDAEAALDLICDIADRSRVALLCYEREATDCHRNLVGRAALRRSPGLVLSHA